MLGCMVIESDKRSNVLTALLLMSSLGCCYQRAFNPKTNYFQTCRFGISSVILSEMFVHRNCTFTKVHDTHSNKLRQLMAQLSCAIKLLQQLHNCVSNKLPKQTCSYIDMDASQLLLLATSFYSPSIP